MFLFFLSAEYFRPEYWFGGQVLERTPAALSLLYIVVLGILLGFLLITFFDEIRRPKFPFERDLPREVVKKLTKTIADRSIRYWLVTFIILAFSVFGFQVYWTYFAEDINEQFQALSYKDLRNRRASAASLRGWLLDRSGKLDKALAFYRVDPAGGVQRSYSLEREMAHLLGTERGTPGLERTIYERVAEPMPEAWEVLTTIRRPEQENRDVRITIDRDLQAFAAQQLRGKNGSIVVLDPQNGDVLAMYSNPSFDLTEAQDLDSYLKLEADKRDKPLLNRSTREFYVPGSTFKLFTVISAFRAGKQNSVFPSYPEGFRPTSSSLPIIDSSQSRGPGGAVSGGCSGGCQQKNITEAFKVSSNQYFAQLAIELGRDRLAETGEALGILPVATPEEALVPRFFPQIFNTSTLSVANSIAPQRSTLVTGKELSLFDIGLEGMGQGYAGQMTPLQMALITAAAGNLEGKLMKPRVEADIPPQHYSQVLTPQQAAAVRSIMSTVTEEPGGTGTVISGKLAGTGIRTGGKTGTAEKETLLYDEETGELKTVTRRRRNDAGELVEYQAPVTYTRTDSWFISLAPIDRPKLAIAVVVEGGGYGSKTAAPIAANIILKARELGLIGQDGTPRKR